MTTAAVLSTDWKWQEQKQGNHGYCCCYCQICGHFSHLDEMTRAACTNVCVMEMMRNDQVLGPFRLCIFPSPLCVCSPPLSIIPHSVQEANLSRNGWPRSSSTPSRHSQWQRLWPSHLKLQVPSLVPRTSVGHYLGRGDRCPSSEQVANTKEKKTVILFSRNS